MWAGCHPSSLSSQRWPWAPHLTGLSSFPLYQHIPSPGSQDRIRSSERCLPAGATSFSRLLWASGFSRTDLVASPSPGQRLLPAEKERLRCQGRELGSRGKRNALCPPPPPSVCLGMRGLQVRKAGPSQVLWRMDHPSCGPNTDTIIGLLSYLVPS